MQRSNTEERGECLYDFDSYFWTGVTTNFRGSKQTRISVGCNDLHGKTGRGAVPRLRQTRKHWSRTKGNNWWTLQDTGLVLGHEDSQCKKGLTPFWAQSLNYSGPEWYWEWYLKHGVNPESSSLSKPGRIEHVKPRVSRPINLPTWWNDLCVTHTTPAEKVALRRGRFTT